MTCTRACAEDHFDSRCRSRQINLRAIVKADDWRPPSPKARHPELGGPESGAVRRLHELHPIRSGLLPLGMIGIGRIFMALGETGEGEV